MKVFTFFVVVLLIFSCGSEYEYEYSEEQIKEEFSKYSAHPVIIEQGNLVLKEVVDIPPFEGVNVKLMHKNVKFRQGSNKLEFELQKFFLGEKTVAEGETGLIKEPSGQYLMVVGDKGEKHFSKHVKKDFNKGENHLLAFLCRSYGISLKSANSYTFHNVNISSLDGNISENTKNPFLYLNKPEKSKKLTITEPVLLDFYLVNFNLKKGGNYLVLKIDKEEIKLTKWCAYTVSGLTVGKHVFSMTAFNKEGTPLSGNLLKTVSTTLQITEGLIFE